ncbi:MAG: putative zinc-binding protein [Acidobacteria bacterium]|nr:putative zinc-binding protein [Acidobacteriota bacterium]
MPELPKRKVGIIACSGEELPEGTVTRLAALRVLESLRPHKTVTICLPLFLAGGEADRAFARFYPTIAVDGCEKRCAARGTEMYSGRPAVSIVVRNGGVAASAGLGSARHLNTAGMQVVSETADQVARHVDELLDRKWDRRSEKRRVDSPPQESFPQISVPCSCASSIPVGKVQFAGHEVALVGLPLIFAELREAGKPPSDQTKSELLQAVKIYNSIRAEEDAACAEAVLKEYETFCREGH